MNRNCGILVILLVTGAFVAGHHRAARTFREAHARFYATVLIENLVATHGHLSMSDAERPERLRRMIRASSRGLEMMMADWDAFVEQAHADVMEIHAGFASHDEVVERISDVLERWGYREPNHEAHDGDRRH